MQYETAQESLFYIHFYLHRRYNILKPDALGSKQKKVDTCSRPDAFPLTFTPLFYAFL